MDLRDRLILSLCALLRTERETRAALHAVVSAGQLSRKVLTAVLAGPVPVITQDDLNFAEQTASGYMPMQNGRMA